MKFIKRTSIFFFKPKVFCIGMNKTGTTTMLKTFKKLNFRTAPQIKQEQAIGDINFKAEHKKIKNFVGNIIFFKTYLFPKEIFIKQLIKFFLTASIF